MQQQKKKLKINKMHHKFKIQCWIKMYTEILFRLFVLCVCRVWGFFFVFTLAVLIVHSDFFH